MIKDEKKEEKKDEKKEEKKDDKKEDKKDDKEEKKEEVKEEDRIGHGGDGYMYEMTKKYALEEGKTKEEPNGVFWFDKKGARAASK